MKFLTSALTLLLLLSSVVSVSAHENADFTYSGVTPDKAMRYSIKRFGEKVQGTFLGLFNKKGMGNFQAHLLKERAYELIYTVEHEKSSYIETAVSRFNTQIGLVKEQLENQNVEKTKVSEALHDIPQKFNQLRDTFPSQTAQWIMMQQTIDSSTGLASQVQ